MKGLLNTALAAVITLALITVPAPSVQADPNTGWEPSLNNVLDLVYCIVGTTSCVGLAPGADVVDTASPSYAAGVAAATPSCNWGTQLWDGSNCVDASSGGSDSCSHASSAPFTADVIQCIGVVAFFWRDEVCGGVWCDGISCLF